MTKKWPEVETSPAALRGECDVTRNMNLLARNMFQSTHSVGSATAKTITC